MGAYVRRFGSEPDEATLLAIESVVIVDQQPPAVVRGIGTGVVLSFILAGLVNSFMTFF